MATAGVALLVSPTSWSHHWVWVAPFLLVAAASAWRARSFALARGHGLVGGGVRRRAAPAGPARTTATSWTIDQQIFGGTYVWFTVLLFVVLWWRWRAAR